MKIQGKGLEPAVPGAKPQAAKAPEKGPAPKKAPAQVKSPEQDPWVQQAKDLLISGKPNPVATKGPAS